MYTIKDFIPLKQMQFKYCDKTYTEERWLSKDKKILILSDNGFDYCKIYFANERKVGILQTSLYHRENRHSYPIYSMEEAIRVINEAKPDLVFEFGVHESQFKNIKQAI